MKNEDAFHSCALCAMNRRQFLSGALVSSAATVAAGVGFPLASSAASAIERLPNSCAMAAGSNLNGYNLRNSTGDKRLDRALISELRNILEIIPVDPGFKIIDDRGSPNAFATSETIVKNTRGTALFGSTMMRQELLRKSGGTAVAGIAAHECAHIYQFFSPYGQRLRAKSNTAKYMELHADLLAGYYMKHKEDRSGKSVDIRTFAKSLYDKGDWKFNDPNHHGTPAERLDAMERGFSFAAQGYSFEQAAVAGEKYVSGT